MLWYSMTVRSMRARSRSWLCDVALTISLPWHMRRPLHLTVLYFVHSQYVRWPLWRSHRYIKPACTKNGAPRWLRINDNISDFPNGSYEISNRFVCVGSAIHFTSPDWLLPVKQNRLYTHSIKSSTIIRKRNNFNQPFSNATQTNVYIKPICGLFLYWQALFEYYNSLRWYWKSALML